MVDLKVQLKTYVDDELLMVEKSVRKNLMNQSRFLGESIDTAKLGVELKPPVPLMDCKYVFDNSYGEDELRELRYVLGCLIKRYE